MLNALSAACTASIHCGSPGLLCLPAHHSDPCPPRPDRLLSHNLGWWSASASRQEKAPDSQVCPAAVEGDTLGVPWTIGGFQAERMAKLIPADLMRCPGMSSNEAGPREAGDSHPWQRCEQDIQVSTLGDIVQDTREAERRR